MNKNISMISITKSFQWVGLASLVLGLLTVLTAVIAYLPGHPEFSIFHTYLSDIGDTQGWAQILFNSGTLLAAPMRFFVLLLLLLYLRRFDNKNSLFEIAVITIGTISIVGTILMTAVPFSVSPPVHKSGIGLYFLGVVFLQSIIGIKETNTKELPKILSWLCFFIVLCFLIFFVLLMLSQNGIVGRSSPVFWEWMCYFSSMLWLLGHSLVLGKRQSANRTV